MFLKKTALIGTLALIALPFTAQADLVTNNYSNEPSTVKLTTGTRICSGIIGAPGITKPHEMHHQVAQKTVDDLCKGSPNNVCRADVYMTSNCTGPVIAHATVNMNPGPSHGEIGLEDLGNPKYITVKNGFSELSMGYR